MPTYLPESRLGTVTCTESTPNVLEFEFVVEGAPNDVLVRRGEFVSVTTDNGTIVARVQNLIRTNRYYQHAEAVREYQSRGEPLRSILPTDRWQYTIAQARVLGCWTDNRAVRPSFSVSPGASVRRPDEVMLASFLNLDQKNGLKLGTLSHHELGFCPSVDRLLSKHLAVLAMSGAGKSYFISVLLEEMLARTKEQGRLAIVVLDVHGEYTYLKDLPAESLGLRGSRIDVEHVRSSHFQIPVPSLSAETLSSFVSDMSGIQVRDLRRVISETRKKEQGNYSLGDLAEIVKEDDSINKNTRDAIVGWLTNLDETGLFGVEAVPDVKSMVNPGKLTLIDLSDFVSLKKKQIVTSYLAGELLHLRRQEKIPPFLFIIEEAHQFCPESRHELALAKAQIETIAREGRKFYALLCLISQRPVRLSTTVLSQCSNQAIFRCTNPYDLEHIGKTSEGIDRSSLESITTLEVGEALFVGECVSFPTFVKIRRRRFEPKGAVTSLSEAIRKADRISSQP